MADRNHFGVDANISYFLVLSSASVVINDRNNAFVQAVPEGSFVITGTVQATVCDVQVICNFHRIIEHSDREQRIVISGWIHGKENRQINLIFLIMYSGEVEGISVIVGIQITVEACISFRIEVMPQIIKSRSPFQGRNMVAFRVCVNMECRPVSLKNDAAGINEPLLHRWI